MIIMTHMSFVLFVRTQTNKLNKLIMFSRNVYLITILFPFFFVKQTNEVNNKETNILEIYMPHVYDKHQPMYTYFLCHERVIITNLNELPEEHFLYSAKREI